MRQNHNMSNLSSQSLSKKEFHLHLISDSTGETIHSLARACVAQFDKAEALEHFWNMVRSERQLTMVIEGIREFGGVVVFSLVDPKLRRQLEEACLTMGVVSVPVIDPVLKALEMHLGMESRAKPGRQHVLDDDYFDRIEAMTYTLAHDDGKNTERLEKADVVLIGVSRTSKTPTCIYLANRGIRAANIPFVPEVGLPHSIETLKRPLIVGLTTDTESLVAIRRQRMKIIAAGHETSYKSDYIDIEKVQKEILTARRIYAEKGWPVLNIARRSIEETAAEIMTLLSNHFHALPHGIPPQ